MNVWILQTGCYEDVWIQGVYATAELAKAAWKGTWKTDAEGNWSNNLDWDDYGRVTVHTVVSE